MEKKNFFATKTGKAVIVIIGYIVIMGLMLLCSEFQLQIPLAIIAIVCIFFGWRFLTRITPDMFLFLSIWGWVIFFVVKLILSIVVGVFVTPFQISKMIANAVGDSVADSEQ